MPVPLVLQVTAEYRAQLRARESAQFRDMRRRWQEVEARLQADTDRLLRDLVGQSRPTDWRLLDHERFQALLLQVRAEVEQYNGWVAENVSGFQADYARLGLDLAGDQLQSSFWQGGQAALDFNRLPVEAVEVMAGLTADGSPLAKRLQLTFPEVAGRMTSRLVQATALGQGPRELARELNQALQVPLWRALRLARSEQMRAFREAARQQYVASGLVQHYKRLAAHQLRTCLACLLMDGALYPVATAFEAHPNCRCALVPVVDGAPVVEWSNGQTWFLGLPADDQQQMLGQTAYAAWQSGRIELTDLVRRRSDSTWGDSLQTATLAELGLR